MTDNLKLIENFTRINAESQSRYLRLFIKLDIETKLKIVEQQNVFFYKLHSKNKDVKKAILIYSSFIMGISNVIEKLEDIDIFTSKLKAKSVKTSSKREKIINLWAIVRTLKLEQKMSFRQIASYVKKYHKLTVVHSTIATMWHEIEHNNYKDKTMTY